MNKPLITVRVENQEPVFKTEDSKEFSSLGRAIEHVTNHESYDTSRFRVEIEGCGEVDRYIAGGRVAVIYSPNFGAGWSTWIHQSDRNPVFDPILAYLIHNDCLPGEIYNTATFLYPHDYIDGIQDAKLKFVNRGVQFIIKEYDGAESVVMMGEISYNVA